MRFQNSLTQVQTIKLNVSPQMQQAIHMLQLTSDELFDFLQELYAGNPLIEINRDFNGSGHRKNKIPKNSKALSQKTRGEFDLLNIVSCCDETLEVFLLSQLRLSDIPDKYKGMIRYLAGNLNDDGYVTVDLMHVGKVFNQPYEEVYKALRYLQSFEPVGVGARSLKECLLIQIQRASNTNRWAYEIVDHHIAELSRGKLEKISQKLNISREEAKVAAEYIRSLNPRPGLAFATGQDRQQQTYIKPDATIQRDQKENFMIILNENYVPVVSLNKEYFLVQQENNKPEIQTYFEEKLREARWLQQNLEKRKLTIYKVIRAIVEEQEKFLKHGIAFLKPMNLKAVSEKLQMHPSTVCRAVKNKYVDTPQGVFELNYFFTTAIKADDGKEKSAESIKAIIKDLIDAEDKRKPISDQKITDILIRDGINISRRTVMKYREEMRVLSSRLRS